MAASEACGQAGGHQEATDISIASPGPQPDASTPPVVRLDVAVAAAPEVMQVGSLWVVRWRTARGWRMESGLTSREAAEAFAASRRPAQVAPPPAPPVLIAASNGRRARAIASRSGAANDVTPALALVEAPPVAEVPAPDPSASQRIPAHPARAAGPGDEPAPELTAQALQRLPNNQRRIVELKLDGLPDREIGARLGVSLFRVRDVLRRAQGRPQNAAYAERLARAKAFAAGLEAVPAPAAPADAAPRAPRACRICGGHGHNARTCGQRLRGADRLAAIERAAERRRGGSAPEPAPALERSATPGADEAPEESPGPEPDPEPPPARAGLPEDIDFAEFLPPDPPPDLFAVAGESPWDPGAAPDEPPDDDDDCPTMDRARLRAGQLKARQNVTIPAKQLRRDERRAAALVVYPEGQRPRTRGDCLATARPCGWVSCRHHLYLDVDPLSGALKLNRPDIDVWDMAESCSLDVADRGGMSLEDVGDLFGLTRERIRQLEERGIDHAGHALPASAAG